MKGIIPVLRVLRLLYTTATIFLQLIVAILDANYIPTALHRLNKYMPLAFPGIMTLLSAPLNCIEDTAYTQPADPLN
jgi:hypothetical protein